MGPPVRIGLISSALAAISPVVDQFRKDMPEATLLHFLDEGLLVEFERSGGLSPRARARTLELAMNAEAAGCVAIACSCSTLSPVLPELAPFVSVPLITVDQEMLRAACERAGRIMVLATAESVLKSVVPTLQAVAVAAGREPEVMATVVTAARAYPRGSAAELRAIAAEIEKVLAVADVAVISQCSMLGCMDYLPEPLRDRVLCAPPYVVSAVRGALKG